MTETPYRNKGDMAKLPFWRIINGMARGEYPYYDVVDLIGEGKFNKIGNIRI